MSTPPYGNSYRHPDEPGLPRKHRGPALQSTLSPHGVLPPGGRGGADLAARYLDEANGRDAAAEGRGSRAEALKVEVHLGDGATQQTHKQITVGGV